MSFTTENPNEETIKCVVVGDNNVGKTRLICARAYNNTIVNKSYFYKTSHQPMVWAIDQYRTNTEVLKNARCKIDGTLVSLRLWDTFGDHHKDRRFAYGKADVVIICFSVCDEKSLRNVLKFWLPEVRRHSKTIPVILVACKVDLRYTDLLELNKHKGKMSRELKQSDIVFPDHCRVVAEELNCPYYESSVLEGYGVHDMFENVCRAALLYRKNLYIWNSGLKRIQRPKLQEPLEPPKPIAPKLLEAKVDQAVLPNLFDLFNDELLCDVSFVCQGGTLLAHKVILAASSDVFYKMFTVSNTSAFKANMQTSNTGRTLCDVTNEVNSTVSAIQPPIFISKRKLQNGCDNLKVDVAANIFKLLLQFCYTGSLVCETHLQHKITPLPSVDILTQLIMLGKSYGLNELVKHCALLVKSDSLDTKFLVSKTFLLTRSEKFKKLFLRKNIFADVLFQMDDGKVPGHKVLLAAGSDMMYAMFAGKFIESENNEVVLPDSTLSNVETIFEYIYTSKVSPIEDCSNVGELIALANRLCLPNLVSQLENMVAKIFHEREQIWLEKGNMIDNPTKVVSLVEDVIDTLCTSQLHNAPRLTEYCLHFICVHYNEACKLAPKKLKKLLPETQEYIELHRWPPVWFIKQRYYYEKSVSTRNHKETSQRNSKKGKAQYSKY